MNAASNALFLDTNILIYANVVQAPFQLLTNNPTDFNRFAHLITVIPLM